MKRFQKSIKKTKSTQWIYMSIAFFLIILVIVLNFSYALFSTKVEKSGTLNIKAGDFVYSITSSDLTNKQITVAAGQEKVFEVTITNTNDRDTSYEMYYKLLSPNILPTGVEIGYANTTKDPVQGTEIKKDQSKAIQLVIRNQSAESITLEFGVQGGFVGKKFTLEKGSSLDHKIDISSDTTGASGPELATNMIPVTYDESSKNWIKADVTNPVKNSWYRYQEQMWANAVMVKETGTKTRADYQNSPVGTVISMEDILQMFVWIPRYKYILGTQTTPMNIVFEDKSVAKSTGTATGVSYLTHPAFTFGDTELNGIWVGKFEPTSDITCTPRNGDIGANCDLSTIKPTIKPNQLSWVGARISTFFKVARNMQESGNIYGYDTAGINTRVARNEEWAAVLYLSQSIYGRCTDITCEEVSYNHMKNLDTYQTFTGCSGGTNSVDYIDGSSCPEENQYHTIIGGKASTTGNIYGIYDMAGGDWEYVMGNYNQLSGKNLDLNSGFTGSNVDGTKTSGDPFPESKYYTIFTGTDTLTQCNGKICSGGAFSEIEGWGQFSNYPSEVVIWMIRGGSMETGAGGMFSFGDDGGWTYRTVGSANYLVSTRFVVSKD